jgi:putative sterol carrier protein
MEKTMKYDFPSEEWVSAYESVINASEEYRRTGANWDKGALALVCKARPDLGYDDDVGIWLDLHKGECREARFVTAEEASEAPFCITGAYERWKQVMQGRLDPLKAIMQGKFRLKGNLADVVRYVEASQTLVNCCGLVPTKFLDE